jgi:dTDP-glucose 4,6-dehydratase
MRVEESYSQAKRASEHLCSLYSEAFGIEVVIARCFSFVGLDLPLTSHFAIGNFIYDALYGDEIVVRSNGDVIRSYMAQEDLAFWLLTVLVKGRNRTTYNVGSDVAISLRDLAFLIRDILAPSIPVQIKGCDDENLFRKKYVPNITRCQTELNLRIKISLEAAIEQFRPFK